MNSIRYLGKVLLRGLQLVSLLFAWDSLACAEAIHENELKMALTFNFARYVEWPALKAGESIDVCVFDNEPLLETFAKLTSHAIDQRTIRVSKVKLSDRLTSCEVLVLDTQNRQHIALALARVKGHPVLTIGLLPDFIDSGGIINLYQEQGRYRFEINPYEAQRSHLQISARLLQLARIVGN